MKKISIQKLDSYWQNDPKFKCQTPNCINGSEWMIGDRVYCSIHAIDIIRLIDVQWWEEEEDNKCR